MTEMLKLYGLELGSKTPPRSDHGEGGCDFFTVQQKENLFLEFWSSIAFSIKHPDAFFFIGIRWNFSDEKFYSSWDIKKLFEL